jgi:hypothetical protein
MYQQQLVEGRGCPERVNFPCDGQDFLVLAEGPARLPVLSALRKDP